MTIPMIDNEMMWERMSLEESLRRACVVATRRRRMTAVVIFSALALVWAVMLIGHANAAQSGSGWDGNAAQMGWRMAARECMGWSSGQLMFSRPCMLEMEAMRTTGDDYGISGMPLVVTSVIKQQSGDKGRSDEASRGE